MTVRPCAITSSTKLPLSAKLLDRSDPVLATVRREGVLDGVRACHPETLYVVSLDITDTPALRRTIYGAFAQDRSRDLADAETTISCVWRGPWRAPPATTV